MNELDRSMSSAPRGSIAHAFQQRRNTTEKDSKKLGLASKVWQVCLSNEQIPEPEGWVRK